VVGGRRSLLSKICAQTDPPLQKWGLTHIFAYKVSIVRDIEKVQTWRIGSRPRALQRTIDWVRTLPLSALKGGSKTIFCSFKRKFNSNQIKSATKYLCVKTSSGNVVLRPFPHLTVDIGAKRLPFNLKFALKVTHCLSAACVARSLCNSWATCQLDAGTLILQLT